MTEVQHTNLSKQAIGALMMALQKSLMNQIDIVPILKEFDLVLNDKEEIVVQNPPIIENSQITSSNEQDEYSIDESENTVGSD